MINYNAVIQNITAITQNSREAVAGCLFAAIPGSKHDGRNFIAAALDSGATYILAPKGTQLPPNAQATLLESTNTRADLAKLCALYYAPQPARIVAVTGTNGKTSTVQFANALYASLGHKSAALGTLGITSQSYQADSKLTTPDTVSLHKNLQNMAASGITHVAMEASSIGIEQHRLDGVHLSAAAYTNLTQDHLDYHGDMDTYFLAKKRLFDLLPNGAPAIICLDDEAGVRLANSLQDRPVITFGSNPDASVRITAHTPHPQGQTIQISENGQTHTIELPLPGLFQGLNALCAALLVAATEQLNIAQLIPHLNTLKGVRGRLEPVLGHPTGASVYVDYAHTAAGLETVLQAVRPHVQGRLICLFGCGGNRDATKRPLMGRAVAKYADIGILTDDNPRSENPASIRAAAKAGAPDAIEIDGRKAAITHAITMLQTGDVLVIAGKGHEEGQEIAGITHPFDDVTEAKAAIAQIKGNLKNAV